MRSWMECRRSFSILQPRVSNSHGVRLSIRRGVLRLSLHVYETGRRNFILTGLFSVWVERDGTGLGFDSSSGFALPNGAKRSPDLAWVKRSRWERLTDEEREEFPPLCPDFVVELRSRSDALEALQSKMRESLANGAQLGWLIDPQQRRVYVYRPGEEVMCLENPETFPGDPVLPGFVRDVQRLW